MSSDMGAVKNEKILGYVLLGAGLLFILFTAHNVYTVFTGIGAAPEIFKMEAIEIPATSNSPVVTLMSGKNFSKLMDLGAWYILMFFFAQAGSKISGIGVQLIKEIKVTVKSKDGLTTIPTE
jgi:hypothetical protein